MESGRYELGARDFFAQVGVFFFLFFFFILFILHGSLRLKA